MTLIFAFGVAFQLPVILTLLGHVGIIDSAWLVKMRRYSIVAVFGIAAILTPPDLISMTSLAAADARALRGLDHRGALCREAPGGGGGGGEDGDEPPAQPAIIGGRLRCSSTGRRRASRSLISTSWPTTDAVIVDDGATQADDLLRERLAHDEQIGGDVGAERAHVGLQFGQFGFGREFCAERLQIRFGRKLRANLTEQLEMRLSGSSTMSSMQQLRVSPSAASLASACVVFSSLRAGTHRIVAPCPPRYLRRASPFALGPPRDPA